MAHIGNNADALLHSLSDFWLRYFKDIEDLRAAYEGTELLFGQAYLDLLSDVLNTAVTDVPLFRKELYRLITIRDTDYTYQAPNWVVKLPEEFVALPRLQNRVWAPTATLTEVYDYTLTPGVLIFPDPGTGDVPSFPNGYAQRQLDIAVGGFFRATSVSWRTLGVRPGDYLSLGATTNTIGVVRITRVEEERLVIDATTPLPGIAPIAACSWEILRGGTVTHDSAGIENGTRDLTNTYTTTETAFWAVDGLVDDHTLFTSFGHLFGRDQASSETYRAFLRGVMQLYLLGPTVERIESALNVMAGLDVVHEDEETLLSFTTGITSSGVDGVTAAAAAFSAVSGAFVPGDVGGTLTISKAANGANIGQFQILTVVSSTVVTVANDTPFVAEAGVTWAYGKSNLQTVVTDKNTYTYPRVIPMQPAVTTSANWGVLVLHGFEPLAAAIRVTDYVEDPEWWYDVMIPLQLMPDETALRRSVSARLFRNLIGGESDPHIGDPGFFIGTDEYNQATSVPYRHNTAFVLMDRFLKAHMFSVEIKAVVELTGLLITDMQRILREVKPAHTYLYFHPQTKFSDQIVVHERALALNAGTALRDTLDAVDNVLRIGGWTMGTQWRYTGPTGGNFEVNAYDTASDDVVYLGSTITHGVAGGSSLVLSSPSLTGSPTHIGDLLVAALYTDGTVITTPAGWVAFSVHHRAAALTAGIALFYHYRVDSFRTIDTTFNYAAPGVWSGICAEYSGVDQVTPLESSGFVDTTAVGSVAAPSGAVTRRQSVQLILAAAVGTPTVAVDEGVQLRAMDALDDNSATVFLLDRGLLNEGAPASATFTGMALSALVQSVVIRATIKQGDDGYTPYVLGASDPAASGAGALERALNVRASAPTTAGAKGAVNVEGVTGGPDEGATFTTDDSVNPPVTYNVTYIGAIVGGDVMLNLAGVSSIEDFVSRVLAAIVGAAGSHTFDAILDPFVPNRIRLSNRTYGDAGNRAITTTGNWQSISFDGLSGGY